MKEITLEASTAGFCEDVHHTILDNNIKSNEMKNEWEFKSNLLREYLNIHE